MSFARLFWRLSERRKASSVNERTVVEPVSPSSLLEYIKSNRKVELPEPDPHTRPLDPLAFDRLADALKDVADRLVIGKVLLELNSSPSDENEDVVAAPHRARITIRFPPDNSPNPPEEGFCMEVFDVTLGHFADGATAYEPIRWIDGGLFLPLDLERRNNKYTLNQLIEAVLKPCFGLVFKNEEPSHLSLSERPFSQRSPEGLIT